MTTRAAPRWKQQTPGITPDSYFLIPLRGWICTVRRTPNGWHVYVKNCRRGIRFDGFAQTQGQARRAARAIALALSSKGSR